MKKLVSVLFTVAFVSILAMSLLAQEGPSQNEAASTSSKEKKPQTTRVWNSYVDGWLNSSPLADDPTFNEVSAFTPESAVIVTRIEVDAHVGPMSNSTNPFSACATNPSLTLTSRTSTNIADAGHPNQCRQRCASLIHGQRRFSSCLCSFHKTGTHCKSRRCKLRGREQM